MNYNIIAVPSFRKEIKKLSKKYPSFKNDFSEFLNKILENPINTGIPIGNNCFKYRLLITSKNKGKSGGARIITHFVLKNATIYLLTIYDKSEKANLTNNELLELLNLID